LSGHQRGFHDITAQIVDVVIKSKVDVGTCTVFVQHTSAGICIQENADPSARYDMEHWLDRIAPEDDPEYTHTTEGSDDMPAHLKAILTGSDVVVPVIDGQLALGTWQGIYFCEFRNHPGPRKIIVVVQ
jgi:secondary thiamine-phosphate synthase enzyme